MSRIDFPGSRIVVAVMITSGAVVTGGFAEAADGLGFEQLAAMRSVGEVAMTPAGSATSTGTGRSTSPARAARPPQPPLQPTPTA